MLNDLLRLTSNLAACLVAIIGTGIVILFADSPALIGACLLAAGLVIYWANTRLLGMFEVEAAASLLIMLVLVPVFAFRA